MVLCVNQGKKRRNPLWIASIFDAGWRKSTPLQAMLPYGASPKVLLFCVQNDFDCTVMGGMGIVNFVHYLDAASITI